MALTPGARLGVYDITAQIGVGGMGEVYQATDTNLKRQVAVKVLPASVSPTLSRHATQAGIILGTAAYMAPEQARGKTVDRRADIWAFGAVLFEMLTGSQPFPGENGF